MSKFTPKYFLAFYALILLFLVPLKPMWLDERLQSSDTYQCTLKQTIERVALDPGGVPLAYIAENLIVNSLGHPLYTSHLFSILCAVGGMASLIWLVYLLGSPETWLAFALTYALAPIGLRYAIEARQYGPALALSICATALLVWLDQHPTWARASIYALALALGLYSQPYVGFTAVAHLLWSVKRPSFKYVLASFTLSSLLFLPWYLYARGFWAKAVVDGGYQSSVNWRTPLMMVRELSGGGYVLTLALVALAVRGYTRTNRLLLYCVLIPIPLVLVANVWFHYFFAIRQMLFVVPPLCLMSAEGLLSLPRSTRPALTAILAIIAVGYDVRWFMK